MWILPSRNRPDRLRHMFDTAPPSTPGIVAIDKDQAKLYSNVSLPEQWQFDIGRQCKYVEKHNNIFKRFPDCAWYGSLSDDMVPITPHWDVMLIMRAKSGIAYANDLFTRRCGAFVIHGDLVRKLGYIFNPKFIHYYGDTMLELISREMKFAGLQEDIIVEHRHYANKKNPGKYDQTSKGRPKQLDEKPVFERWRDKEWPTIKQNLLAYA